MPTNLPTDLLRCFVTVIDLGSFTRAAHALGRTQPAVSLQIRRLEDLLQAKLIRTTGRQFALTDAGRALGPYARQMLRLNDDVVAHFSDATLSGWIRVGVPTDVSNAALLETIADFAAAHSTVRIEVESLNSSDLRDYLTNDRLDIAVALTPDDDAPFLVQSAVVEPFWAVKSSFQSDPGAPLPILRHPDPCEYASRMRAALRRSGRGWRTALVSRDVAGIQTAIHAGLGASALTPAALLPGMRAGRPEEGFPPLEPLHLGLFYKHSTLNEAGQALAQQLLKHMQIFNSK